ncbi:copper oxidase [Sporosarcina sp. ANT_H38]|uniref:multicopper oxidase family protein n=1 Tax=Sporosarcina sp. ANT_H38 TaxID=2597358 RepID=UPI0011F260D0|nr:multicopper oxidase domain-containing protein [Sporosarcina sp. ANT_H38]KAA0965310.1 copper oxidase [Sporosarcina sp. ANT_H38]
MKMKLWIIALLASVLIIGGCSEKDSQSNGAMDHSEMGHGDMENTDQDASDSMGNGHMSHNDPVKLNDSTGENELKIPSVLKRGVEEGIDYTVRAQKGKTEVFDGHETDTYGYNGSFLGPMIRIKQGETIKINTINELYEETTFHWHGLELPGEADGSPHKTLKPGEEKLIEFEVAQEAATLWFHPHPDGNTAEQVYNGLAGLVYIEDENSTSLDLPDDYGVNDIPLIFQDRTFDDDKQLNYQAAKNEDGTIGDTLLINGTLNPKLTVPKEKVRLRLLNGANARDYTFKLTTGDSFVQVATDGGFLNEPVTMNEITLAPSERAEIIIDFSRINTTGDLALINDQDSILLPFEMSEQPGAINEMPGKMNDFSITEEEMNLPVSKRIELFGMGEMVTINGKKFDMNRIDFTQEVGVTEVWELYNKPDMMGGMNHPFHIHGTQFKIISIDGKEPNKNERGWKDSISLKPEERVKIAVKFNHSIIFMFHCHILEHEDNGMMGQIKVE